MAGEQNNTVNPLLTIGIPTFNRARSLDNILLALSKEMSEEEFAKFKDENHNIMKWKTEDGKQIIMKKKMMKKEG